MQWWYRYPFWRDVSSFQLDPDPGTEDMDAGITGVTAGGKLEGAHAGNLKKQEEWDR